MAVLLSQCPGGQCVAPAAQPAPIVAYAPPPAYYRTPAVQYYRTYPGYYRTSRPVVTGYTVCTPQGCYRR